MNKEQIAEIKNKFHSFLNQSERSTIAISQNHLILLIEQAQRAQELEKKRLTLAKSLARLSEFVELEGES